MERTLKCLVGGLCMAGAFPPFHLYPLVLPAFALLYASVSVRAKGAFFCGFLWGLSFFLPLTYWVSLATESYLPWIALTAVEAAFVGLWAHFVNMFSRTLPAFLALAVAAVSWAGVELIRGLVPFGGFAWGFAAYPWADSWVGAVAPYAGAAGVSALTYLAGGALASIRRPSNLVVFICALVLPLALPAPGVGRGEAGFRDSYFAKVPRTDQEIEVAAIQGGVPLKVYNQGPVATASAHMSLGRTVKGADLVVMGENAGEDPRVSSSGLAGYLQIVKQNGPVLTGTVRYEDDHRFNDYVAVSSDGVGPVYTKQAPVPFGEYVPYQSLFRHLSPVMDQIRQMLPGKTPALLKVNTPKGNISVITPICFEVAKPQLLRPPVMSGGGLIIVPSNNSSFGSTAQSRQQLQILQFRAREMVKSGVQISTSGMSGFVNPDGQIESRAELYEESVLRQKITINNYVSYAVRYGNTIESGTILFTLSVWFVAATARLIRAGSGRPRANARNARPRVAR
ncbi:MAG: apolipoprotein N-acyltransferase [Actinomycetaceae bacterium]|nr:apolipoprotein N-acyltransferase [Actinomycetaceae bacterium]